MKGYFVGLITGALLVLSIQQAQAGFLSHAAAYEYGKHVGKESSNKKDCACPPQQ